MIRHIAMKKQFALIIAVLLFSIALSGCIFDDPSETRTLGNMMQNYSDFEFEDYEVGEEVSRIDVVEDAHYSPTNNTTKVWMQSYSKRPILFKGDLTSNYYISPGSYIEYNVTVFEWKGIEHIKEFYDAKEGKI